jgi:formyl-CoA transferase
MYLADFGADVIKVDDPVNGDGLRKWGLEKDGVPLMSKLVNRNKRCITLDLRHSEGQGLARRLAENADVVIENFRPGTLERWGLDFESLRVRNERLVMAGITGYGQTGPYSDRPGFGTLGEALSGFAARNGHREGPPTLASFGLGDTSTALLAAFGVMVALHHAERTGKGQYIDLSLYDALLTLLGSHVVDFDQLGFDPGRTGSGLPFAAPRNIYETSDGDWVVIAGSTQRTFERVTEALGLSDVAADERFATNSSRLQHVDELDREIQSAVLQFTLAEVLDRLEDVAAPGSPVFGVADVLSDPHMQDREATFVVQDEELGSLRMQSVVPRLSRSPGSIKWAGPVAGAHNRDVYVGELALDESELQSLIKRGVI